jgi:signal peptidase I
MVNLNSILPLKRFIIEGHSMEPAFRPGDKVVINRLAYFFAKPKPGDVVALKESGRRGKILLKRIEKDQDNNYLVVGVNKDDSFDGRKFGSITRKQIIGRLLIGY